MEAISSELAQLPEVVLQSDSYAIMRREQVLQDKEKSCDHYHFPRITGSRRSRTDTLHSSNVCRLSLKQRSFPPKITSRVVRAVITPPHGEIKRSSADVGRLTLWELFSRDGNIYTHASSVLSLYLKWFFEVMKFQL